MDLILILLMVAKILSHHHWICTT